MTDHKTIEVYNARAADYAKLVTSGNAPDATLSAFIARLSPGARVLDMGCGPGNSAAHMAAAGLSPDPVDPAAAMIDIARSEHDLPARIGDFYALDGPYDAVWANFSLLHMPRNDVAGYFPLLHDAMVPGGLLHLGLKTGQNEERDAIGRQYSYFTIAEITEWLTTAGFMPEKPVEGAEKGLAGTMDAFFTLSALRS